MCEISVRLRRDSQAPSRDLEKGFWLSAESPPLEEGDALCPPRQASSVPPAGVQPAEGSGDGVLLQWEPADRAREP